MPEPYYADDAVTLYLGDSREIHAWLAADVLLTDPPYGIGWKRGANPGRGSAAHAGIRGDADTAARDDALALWGDRPAMVFGSFYAPHPAAVRHVLVYRKLADSGVVGSTTGYRRDVEPVFLLGLWPKRPGAWSSVVSSNARGVGHLARKSGHPHAKPVDVLEALIGTCPPGVVADPFAGSGSTLVAARNLGRRAIGVEIDERYAERAARRLSQAALPLV
ncbi:site-specific DNA-methyltransferase [Actinocorallia libanotica]|uniref:Methyltransferase n=1 Tax=Actinocorallia libanotica TaxID=46162 RepID=A0ABP4CM27_9ACTN